MKFERVFVLRFQLYGDFSSSCRSPGQIHTKTSRTERTLREIFTEFTWAARGRGKSVKCFSSIKKLPKCQMDEISYLQGLTLVTQGFLN